MKTVNFSETIAACDLKVGGYRELIEFMNVSEYSRSKSFLTFALWLFTNQNLNLLFSETTGQF